MLDGCSPGAGEGQRPAGEGAGPGAGGGPAGPLPSPPGSLLCHWYEAQSLKSPAASGHGGGLASGSSGCLGVGKQNRDPAEERGARGTKGSRAEPASPLRPGTAPATARTSPPAPQGQMGLPPRDRAVLLRRPTRDRAEGAWGRTRGQRGVENSRKTPNEWCRGNKRSKNIPEVTDAENGGERGKESLGLVGHRHWQGTGVGTRGTVLAPDRRGVLGSQQ